MKNPSSHSFRIKAAQHPLRGILGALVLVWGVLAIPPAATAQASTPIIVVNSTGDASDLVVNDADCDTGALNSAGSPECTLRAAIEYANQQPNTTDIDFAIPASDPGLSGGVWTIQPATPFPNITAPTNIDAATQSTWADVGDQPVPVVTIDGGLLSNATQPGFFFVSGAPFSGIYGMSIVGFPGHAIQSNEDDTFVQTSFIGLRPDLTPDGNGGNGVFIRGTNGLIARNVIAANVNDGITLDSNVSGTVIARNLIGLDPNGVAHGNINGIWSQGTGPIRIGGTSATDSNVIANNTFNGIQLEDGQDTSINRNSIYNNGSGIVLGTALTPNDPGDGDTGPNGLINFPVLQDSGTPNQVDFQYDGIGSTYRIEFFTNSSGPHPSGRGAGEVYVGSIDINHPGGVANYSFSDPALTPGTWISATNTLLGPSPVKTSEFAPSFQMPGGPRSFVVNSTGDADLEVANGGQCRTGNFLPDSSPECTLRAALTLANEQPSRDEISFNIPTTDAGHSAGVWTIQPATAFPGLNESVVLDGSTQPGFVGNPVIELDGQGSADAGLLLFGDNSLVQSLSVGGFGDGIRINTGTGSQILGNHVGIDASGTQARPNSDDGIDVTSGTSAVEVGGANAGEGNLVGNNNDDGISVCCGGVTGLLIRGNVVGTDISETLDMGNGDDAITISGAVTVTIGGATVGAGNTLVNSPDGGVSILGPGADVDIQGNLIGVTAGGAAMGNNHGVIVQDSSTSVQVGGTTVASANTIANQIGSGVQVSQTSRNVYVNLNSIHSNGFGIELAPDSPNDPGDDDTGANDQLNRPVVTGVVNGASTFQLLVDVDVPPSNYRLEVFDNQPGESQGRTLLGTSQLDTTGGSTLFSRSFTGNVTGDLTATLTPCDAGCVNYNSGTSPFSAAVTPAGATLEVNSTSDSPDAAIGNGVCDTGSLNSEGDVECTLRAALDEIRSGSPLDTIHFNIPVSDPGHNSGTWTLQPASDLPRIPSGTSLDARTQPGYVSVPVIELDGSAVVASVSALLIDGRDASIRGFMIHSFSDDGIEVDGQNFPSFDNQITDNWIGVDRNLNPAPNGDLGILVIASAANNFERNVIVANGGNGIDMRGAGTTNNRVVNNWIGELPDGTPIPNTGWGVDLYQAATNTIVGESGLPNVISNNATGGILIRSDAGGGTVIGHNDIEDNTGNGIQLSAATNVQVVSNTIQRNSAQGILALNTVSADIGGPGQGNVISGNGLAGISVDGSTASLDVVGNTIGLSDLGAALGNQTGVQVVGTVTELNIGDSATEIGNLIVFNTGAGIEVGAATTQNVYWAANLIHSNGVGIELSPDTPNDPGDADTGANHQVNRPVLSQVTNPNPISFNYRVELDVAIGEYRLDLYDNNPGESQGRVYLGSQVFDKTDPGAQSFSAARSGQVAGVLTATLTPCDAGCVNPQLGSSPFSAPVPLSTSTALVNSTGVGTDNNVGDGLCDTGSLNSEGDAECTLIAAVTEANASALVDTIHFAIPLTDPGHSAGVWTITPTNRIDPVTETAVLDARTQPGYAGAPVIEVDGSVSALDDGLRLETTALNSELYGFAVFNYGDAGIWSRANDSILAHNYSGLRADGSTAAPNSRGIDAWDGVQGVQIFSNVASGNTDSGIGVFDPGTSDILIDGNFVGTNASGTAPVPNGGNGIIVSEANSVDIGTVNANVVSGNAFTGIVVTSTGSATIEDNLIGLNAAGDAAIANGGDGVFVNGTSSFVNIGTVGNPNFIGGNVGNGVVISSASNLNTIRNNYIGTDVARSVDLGNGLSGVLIRSGAQDVAISNNTIANNGLDGIRSEPGVTSWVGAIYNETFNNGGLGFDIGGDGPTLNDLGDADSGTNGLLNYPVIQAINPSGGQFEIEYSLDAPAGNYVVTFYTNPSGADPSGFGESEFSLQSDLVSGHPGGSVIYTTGAVPIVGGSAISGAVHVNGGSGNAASEYGPVFNFTGISTVNTTGDAGDANIGDGICSTGSTVSTGDPACTLRAAIEEANSPTGGESVIFNILPADAVYDQGGNGEFTILPNSPLPPITNTISIDGSTQPGYGSHPLIELDGSLSSCPSATCSGLRFQGGIGQVNALAISSWGVNGIELDADPASAVTNSVIGTDVTGTFARPNGQAGVRASAGTVGGADLAGNTIAFNGGPGVAVVATTEVVTVTHNSIHSNSGLGIDLNDDGRTANDSGDGDTGANGLLNSPVITGVSDIGSGQIQIDGFVDVPAGDYMVQIYKNPVGANANGDVQAQILQFSVPLTSSGSGAESFTFTAAGAVGDRVTLTLTEDPPLTGLGGTSEISQAVTAVPNRVVGFEDASVNRNDAGVGNGVSTADSAPGAIGGAKNFDSTTDSVPLPVLNTRSGALSVSAWVNPSTIGDAVVVSTEGPLGDQFSIGTLTSAPDGTATATVVVDGSPITVSGGTVTAGNWHQLAATWDSANLELFVNGVSVATASAPGALYNDSDGHGWIGAPGSGTGSFIGLIDEVRVMPGAVSPDWILADYQFGSGTNQTGTFGARETGAALPWTQVGSGGRSGSGAASAPTVSPGQSWLVADGVDEVGIEFESWWYLTTDTGVDVGQGTRTATLGGAQNEVRVSSAAGFEISEFGPGGSNQLQAPTGGAYGAGWRRVRVRIDQDGAAIVAVDGIDLPGPVLFDSDPASGSIGFRSVALPNGEQWLVDDVLARRYVNPEPTSTVYNYERR